MGHLVEFLGDVDLEAITHHELVKFMLYLKNDFRPEKPVSGSWLENHWKALRTFYNWTRTIGIENAATNLPRRPRYQLPPLTSFSAEEIRKILAACDHSNEIKIDGKKPYRIKRPTSLRDRALVLTLLDTGVRLGGLATCCEKEAAAGAIVSNVGN